MYRKELLCHLSQTFDETGILLEQYVEHVEVVRSQLETIDTETEDCDTIDSSDLTLPLSLEPKMTKLVGVGQQLRLYKIDLPIWVWQLFDEKGKPLGQILNNYIDDDFEDYGLGHLLGYVADWNGRKMKSTAIDRDEDLPFPHIPLPFEYVLQAEFVQPERVTAKEKRLVKRYLWSRVNGS